MSFNKVFLKKLILEHLSLRDNLTTRDPCDLTVGVEHEFFLLDKKSSSPAEYSQSQEMLAALSGEKNWDVHTAEVTQSISKASWEMPDGRYLNIKYDHSPHLLEIATGYSNDLNAISEQLQTTFEVLSKAADKASCSISSSPILPLSDTDPKINSDQPLYKNLRSYRKKLFEKRSEVPAFINYAAKIAATQTHVGGINWWSNSEIINSLYHLEPDILYYNSILTHSDLSSTDLLKTRWSGYDAVFKGYPLVGFPKIEHWNVESWIDALYESPLFSADGKDWSGDTLAQHEGGIEFSLDTFFKSVRDLQIIRPRLFGTLEFRSDPAQKNPSSILAIMALRLGLCAWAMNREERKNLLSERSNTWWRIVRGAAPTVNPNILQYATEGLKKRNKGELKFLDLIEQESSGQLRKAK